jgi:tripartite-type tricarboxylate transporter receptor subunit TctC
MDATRFIARIAVLLAAAASPLAAHAQDFPTKPVRFIVPFPPGGATDTFARILGQEMTASWGQQVVIDNRPGAGGNIAAELAAKAIPDGYTIIIVGMSHAVNVSLYSRIGYHPVKHFAPVIQVASVESFLVVHPSLPVNSVKELIALAKARPGQLNYGSGGNGAPGHLAGELFKMLAGINMVHVPYKGAQSMVGLLNGDHTVEFNNLITVGAHIKSGKVRVLAVGSAKRSPLMPQMPTMREAGVPDYEKVQWFGVLAPAGTPRPVILKLNSEMARAMKLPDVTKRLRNLGSEPMPNSPEQFDALIKSEIRKWEKVIKVVGIRVD